MATRRGAGEGSVVQRPDGRWVGMVHLGYRDGKRIRRYVYGKTSTEARTKLKAAIRAQDDGLQVPGERDTVARFLERWLVESAQPALRPRTFESYAVLLRRHAIPSLGRIPLAKLSPQDVQGLLNAKLAANLSPQTVTNLRAVLRRALAQAVRWGMVPRNAAALVEAPRVRRPEVRAMGPEDAQLVLAAVRGDRLAGIVTVALMTGLRQGELLGLRWPDVDLDAGTLAVRNALQRSKGRVELVEPKTMRSRRTIVMPRGTIASLREHRRRQLEEKLWAGSAWRETGHVFTTSVGTPMLGGTVTKRFQELLAAADLPRMRFHDLRHGCASLLLSQGVHPRVVMETLGHSAIHVTMNTYSHVIPALQRDAADRMDAALGL